MLLSLVLALSVALAIMAICVGALGLTQGSDEVEARLAAYAARSVDAPEDEEDNRGSRLAEQLNRLISSRNFAGTITSMLARADVPLKVPEFVLLSLGCMAGGAILGVFISREFISGIVLGAVGLFAPRTYLQLRQGRRQRAFEDQLPDVLTMLVGALRAGYSLLQSLKAITEEMPPPASEELRRVVQEVGLGVPQERALANMVLRMESDDLDLIVTAVNVQHEVGGNLATILETMSTTLRDRMRIHREIKVITAQQRLTGYVLAFMPFALAGVLLVINPTYMLPLFENQSVGCLPSMICLPIGSLVLVMMGFMVIRKIVAIKV